MNTAVASLSAERLFVPFLDEVDGVLCLPAAAAAKDIVDHGAKHRLRFPLLLDETATLRAQIEAATHAPASCRFGPFCDNILGMNWKLPSGQLVRIGERVVKSTTGYDWLRFLLHSGLRFGEPVDYVLRLRTDCGFTLQASFRGEMAVLRRAIQSLLRGGWMHWWDSVDFIQETDRSEVRVVVHGPRDEADLFEAELRRVADAAGSSIEIRLDVPPPRDGLPDLVIKTTPGRAVDWAHELAKKYREIRCVALCYSGVLHVYSDHQIVESLVSPLAAEIYSLGGDWHSRHRSAVPANEAESQWLKVLEEAIHA